MKFRDLQRFFSGEYTEEEQMNLFLLTQYPKGKKILVAAIKEGWDASSGQMGIMWDSDACFYRILKKITSDYY
jgi:hypothetical protein